MSDALTHVCCVCRHKWQSVDDCSGRKAVKAEEVARHVRNGVVVNKDGPYCNLCLHLEMAERYAIARGFTALEGATKKWRVLRKGNEMTFPAMDRRRSATDGAEFET